MALTRSTGRLAGLRDCLLTEVDANDVDSVLEVSSRPGSGLVLVGEEGLTTATRLVRAGLRQPVLADRRRYAGKRRVRGTARFGPTWVLSQRHLGLPVILTDSGYIGDADVEALESILAQTARLETEFGTDVVATLPLQ